MKKMYLLTIFVIVFIVFTFLFFYRDENTISANFLKTYGYDTEASPDIQTYYIPREFDQTMLEYNLIQLSSGYDLSAYKGRVVQKYTYRITNLPFPLYSNILMLNGKIISADLTNPSLDGFILPVLHINDLIKNHTPATNDAVIP